MDYEQIRYEVDDHVLTLTLNRPERFNAFTGHMRTEMCRRLRPGGRRRRHPGHHRHRGGARVLRRRRSRAGRGTFNYDSNPRGQTEGTAWERDGGGLLSLRIFELNKPIIAAVNGAAVGVGVTMQLPMDIRIAAESARFGFVFSRRGIVPEACSSWFLPRVVGISQALEWTYSGRVFPASEALAGGLVSRSFPTTSCCRPPGRWPRRSPRTPARCR